MDTYGHVTGLATATETVTDTNTTYTGGTNISLSGTTFNLDNDITVNTIQSGRYNMGGTTFYIDNVSGDYGSIRVQGNSNSWAGYAINDDWVFMANGADRAGLYNDTDNEWAIQMYRNAQVDLYHNGGVRLSTTSYGVDIPADLNFSSNNHYLSSYSANNPEIKTSANSSTGFLVRNSSGGNPIQLYRSGDYGFLATAWGSWDIRKAVGGRLYTNNNTTYYLQPNNMTKLYNLNIVGRLESNGSYGTSGQVLTSNGSNTPTWQDAGGGAWEVIGNYTGTATGTNATLDFVHGSGGFVHDNTTYKHYKMYAMLWNPNGQNSCALQVYPLLGTTSSYAPASSLTFFHDHHAEYYPEFTGVSYGANQWGYQSQYGNNGNGYIASNIRLERSATTAYGSGMGMFSETINGTSYSSSYRFYATQLKMSFDAKGVGTDFGLHGHLTYKYDDPSIYGYYHHSKFQIFGLGFGKVGWRIRSTTQNASFNYDVTWIGLKP